MHFRKRWQNFFQKPSPCLTHKTIWIIPKFCPSCWNIPSSILDWSPQLPTAQLLFTTSHLPLIMTDCNFSPWDDQRLVVLLCHLIMKSWWLLVRFSVARQSWFQSQLLLCSWVITSSKIWTINPAVITGNMHWDSCEQCTVKWTSVWLHVLKENKSLSFAHLICYPSFICSHDFVRQLCVATLVNTKLLREVQYSYLPLGTEAQKKNLKLSNIYAIL